MLAYSESRLVDGARDAFPDLLWPAVLSTLHGDTAIALFRRMRAAIRNRFGTAAVEEQGLTFDSRLSSLEQVAEDARLALIDLFGSDALRPLIPDELVAILRLYPEAPGGWLLRDPWQERGQAVAADEALTLVARAFAGTQSDGHRKALMQFPALEWLATTGKLSVPPEVAKQMNVYPEDPETVAISDAFIRSTSVFRLGVPDEPAALAEQWARAFWNRNWRLTPCMPAEDRDDGDPQRPEDAPAEDIDDLPSEGAPSPAADPSQPQPAEEPQAREPRSAELASEADRLAERVDLLANTFLGVALDHAVHVDLYSPAKHEVICGLISRAARAVLAASLSPDTWSGEHGAGVIRLLAETEIVMSWLDAQDEAAYDRYQKYGRGKGKLAHAHMRGLLESFDGNAPDYLVAATERLGRQIGDDWAQEFVEVDLGGTFSGKSLRDMAHEVGLAELYRFVYQPASAVTHGEWWTIEDFAMQRCFNPLHRFHLIPSFDGLAPTTPQFGSMLAGRLEELVQLAVRILIPSDATAEQEDVHPDNDGRESSQPASSDPAPKRERPGS